MLTLPQFFSFYKREGLIEQEIDEESIHLIPEVTLKTAPGEECPPPRLPKTIYCGKVVFNLIKKKPFFWRTFTQNEMNGESFYYQQIVLKKPCFQTTFEKLMQPYHTWKSKL